MVDIIEEDGRLYVKEEISQKDLAEMIEVEESLIEKATERLEKYRQFISVPEDVEEVQPEQVNY